MARKPTLSPSKISTYLACPVKYRWTYVDMRGRYYLRAKSYYSFGSTLHRVLERFHDSGDAGVTTTHEAIAALEESWIDAGYSSAQEMQEALGEGRTIVESYVDQVRLEPTTAQTLFVERTLRMDMGDWELLGRIDRLDEQEDGTLEIVDYKTGREGVGPDDVLGDLALGCYQLLVRDRYPGRPVVATIVALRSGERATASLSEQEAEELLSDLRFLGEQILHREYEEITPVFKGLCRYCDFLPLCRQHPDFAHEEGPLTFGEGEGATE